MYLAILSVKSFLINRGPRFGRYGTPELQAFTDKLKVSPKLIIVTDWAVKNFSIKSHYHPE